LKNLDKDDHVMTSTHHTIFDTYLILDTYLGACT
jgi:hypothetical protein